MEHVATLKETADALREQCDATQETREIGYLADLSINALESALNIARDNLEKLIDRIDNLSDADYAKMYPLACYLSDVSSSVEFLQKQTTTARAKLRRATKTK